MSRFFKSAAFPILIVVVLAFFANKLISPGSSTSKTTYSEFLTQLDDNQLKSALQNMIDTALGPNHAVVTVNSTLNFNKTSTKTTGPTWGKNVPPSSYTTTKETYSGTTTAYPLPHPGDGPAPKPLPGG